MDLLQKILNCNEEDIDTIIQQAIEEADSNSEKVEKLGFINLKKSISLFKGFIPLNARISIENLSDADYGMQTTDYMYEFAHFVKKNNINTIASLLQYLENFINSYFGMPGKRDIRVKILREVAWFTTTDEEFFSALDNNELGVFKNKRAARCTERSALAQQILSLFGIESYYCIGCIDLGEFQEPHCFNIVKGTNLYAVLDYSWPVLSYSKEGILEDYTPFVGALSNEEFSEFINQGTIKNFENYKYIDGQKTTTGERFYVVGVFKIDKNRNKTGNELQQQCQ